MAESVNTGGVSLLDTRPSLPGMEDFVTSDVAENLERSEMGVFSAMTYFEQNPAQYRAIARGVLEGLSDRACARIWNVHHRIVAAIREREMASAEAESYRARQAQRARIAVSAATDVIIDKLETNPSEVSVKDLAAVVKVLGEQERVLQGAPTSIVGVIRADGALAKLDELLKQAQEADVIEAEEVREIHQDA